MDVGKAWKDGKTEPSDLEKIIGEAQPNPVCLTQGFTSPGRRSHTPVLALSMRVGTYLALMHSLLASQIQGLENALVGFSMGEHGWLLLGVQHSE